jgi:hypothetical protein
MKLLAHTKRKKLVIGVAIFLIAIFTLGAVVLLSDSYGLGFLRQAVDVTPGEGETKKDYETLLALAESVLDTNGEVKTYLILFQNNLELRPGGGFIGSFGILKIRDGQLVNLEVHDVVNVDFRVPYNVEAPYPMPTTIGVKSWSFRDSNFSPHYPENVKQAELFYNKFGGEENFDGVVAITTHVLESVLEVTGPVEVPGFPGTYDAKTGVIELERQVEKSYVDQGIVRGERKAFMKDLASVILEKVKDLPLGDKYRLFQILLADMHAKDVQLSFDDQKLQSIVAASGWDGRMNETWNKDYLMVVDANLNSFKSDHFINRSYLYELDSTVSPPQAKVTVTYNHTAKERDWLVKDYQTYLRIYLPKGAYVTSVSDSVDEPRYGEYLGKKYVGMLQQVALGTTKSVTVEYTLPEALLEDYDLLIERQPGIKEDTKVTIKQKTATGTTEKTLTLDRNKKLSEVE